MKNKSNLEDTLRDYEDTKNVKTWLKQFPEDINKEMDYIPFSFNGRALDNFKLLNSLKLVIPEITNLNSHEGSIYVEFKKHSNLIFSGETTAEIIEKLVSIKINEDLQNGKIRKIKC